MARLLFFAALREAAGGDRTLDVDAATVGEALKIAIERYGPGFERILGLCSILSGGIKVTDPWATPLGEEVALLPPVSGGGEMEMIDVGDKDETRREATAVCRLVAEPGVRDRLLKGAVKKGDARGAATVAGILAAKRVPELIPLCHPVRTTSVSIEMIASGADVIEIRATVRGLDRTGFEMEALTAASVAALTLYDFAKAEDPRMRVESLRIVSKSGGSSGSVTFE
jgi:cyclic pyranopterin monophosphate synthase